MRSIGILALVGLAAGVPRIMGALLVHKEPFGDAYCYIEQVSGMRWKMVTGTFSVADLFGFWLPLYQFFCTIISLVVNQENKRAQAFYAKAGFEFVARATTYMRTIDSPDRSVSHAS